MIELDTLDLLILDSMCLDYQIKEVYILLGIPKSTLTTRLGLLKDKFNVKTNTGLIFKYSNLE
jgi:hypothetical protein